MTQQQPGPGQVTVSGHPAPVPDHPVPVSGRPAPAPGRPAEGDRAARKRQDICRAALRLFLADGYARTSMDAIAAGAGVSKRTVYDYYGDKESLLLLVIREAYTGMLSTFVDIINSRLAHVTDVQRDLTAFAREAALTVTNLPERAAMIRLMMTEAPHFPELRSQHLRPLSATGALADRLAAIAADGLLDIEDPAEAAGHLFALTFGQINNRSMFGAVPVSPADIDRYVTSGVRAFIRAYRPQPDPSRSPGEKYS
jgi:TetR/AcrR family transcriptional repressor of mexJK operon